MQYIIITLTQTCDMSSALSSVSFNQLQLNIKRTTGCERIYEPRYNYVLLGDKQLFRFILNTTDNADLSSASGLQVVAKCNPAYQTDCDTFLSQLMSNQNTVTSLTVIVSLRLISTSSGVVSETLISDSSLVAVSAPTLNPMTSVSLMQTASSLKLTLESNFTSNQSMSVSASCKYQTVNTTDNATNVSSASTLALNKTSVFNKNYQVANFTQIDEKCKNCDSQVFFTCDVTVNSVTYFDIKVTQGLRSSPSTNVSLIVILIVLVIALIGAIILAKVLKNKKVKQFSKPIGVNRGSSKNSRITSGTSSLSSSQVGIY
ncbi:Conserved_hypothetical protein [Hexamita inflata]|uniref:Uncharacterized protein n=1 Tax=Hexamita inflata TaxID=28002 RepID=A0AA86QJR6_9EUKA|nr:Conserved hypothetical protein [Hexamita inflata]